ncbi:acyltransferase [Stappia sp. BW2]|jgi:peptidoglycan/LPS O-acetylase OafA/YrhL|uniref:acyltransferase family protein n=1 Tax=Stappia sp. BW2 TaxID=2592622 RepID=UPI0011DEBEA2|nr:acyltransferase [Stappia sp. BW2]TYC75979.1 acyltransferase [Stappia sp. BW2]
MFSTSQQSSQFNYSVHGLRGVASIMVLIAHILGGTAEHIYNDRPGYVEGIVPFHNFGTFGVMLFFVISGFVILPSVMRYSPKEFALRRLLRLYPLFLVSTLFFAVLNGVTNRYPDLNNLESVFFSLTFLDLFTPTKQVAPNAWSLSYEVIFYTLSCMTYFFLTRKMNIFWKVASLAIPILFTYHYPKALFFLSGAAIFWLYKSEITRGLKYTKTLEAIAFVVWVYLATTWDFKFRTYEFYDAYPTIIPAPALLVLSTATYFFFAASRDSLTGKLLSNRVMFYFGTISYSFYLVHPYIYFATRYLFSSMNMFGENIFLSLLLFGTTVFCLTTLFSHFSYLIFERMPYQIYFGQKIYRSRRVQNA